MFYKALMCFSFLYFASSFVFGFFLPDLPQEMQNMKNIAFMAAALAMIVKE